MVVREEVSWRSLLLTFFEMLPSKRLIISSAINSTILNNNAAIDINSVILIMNFLIMGSKAATISRVRKVE
jgi:hypothetical protein